MKIEILYNGGALAICKVDNRPFNYCDKETKKKCIDAFCTIYEHWKREDDNN